MSTEQVLLTAFLVNSVLLVITLILIFVFRPSKKDEQVIKHQLEAEAKETIHRATIVADGIVKAAQVQVEETRAYLKTQTEQTLLQMQKGLEQTLSNNNINIQTSTAKALEDYHKNLLNLNESLKNYASELQQKLGAETAGRIDQFNSEIQKEIAAVRELNQEKVTKKLEAFDLELTKIKQENFAALEKNIFVILGRISKKVLGRSIDTSTHEQLVMDALEKAKKENLLWPGNLQF